FLVTLAPASASTVTVDYQTAADTATQGTDYQAASGTLTFAPGAGPQPVSVTVNADSDAESPETFFVNLSNANGATIAAGQGVGTIYDPGSFFTLVPCRILDTRNPNGPYGGPALAASTTRSFAIAGQCGIPASARAISVNVTVTSPTTTGNLRLFAAGT